MANSNLNTKIIPFFDSVKNPLTEAAVSKSFFNLGFDNFALEISGSGTATLTIEGCINTVNAQGEQMDDDDCTWTPLSTLSAKDYAKSSAISNKGIYYVGISGLSRIRVNVTSVTGSVIIVGSVGK